MIVGLDSLLSIDALVPLVNGELDWDTGEQIALEQAKERFISWLQNPESEPIFNVLESHEIVED
jgi:hypothetical protein